MPTNRQRKSRSNRTTGEFAWLTHAHLIRGHCLLASQHCELCYAGTGPTGQEWADRPGVNQRQVWERHKRAALKEWQEDPRSDGGKVPCWAERELDGRGGLCLTRPNTSEIA